MPSHQFERSVGDVAGVDKLACRVALLVKDLDLLHRAAVVLAESFQNPFRVNLKFLRAFRLGLSNRSGYLSIA